MDVKANPKIEDISETSSLEKTQISQLEHGAYSEQKRKYVSAGLKPEDADFLLSLSPKEQSAIYRKVDFRVVPMLA